MSLVVRYASRDVVADGAFWKRKLSGEITFSRQLQDTFFGFQAPTSFRVRLPNVDGELTALLDQDRRTAQVNLKWMDTAAGNTAVLDVAGRLAGYELGDEAVLDVAVELPSSLLTMIPKGQITVQAFPKATDLGMPIPVMFGNVKKLPLAYIFGDLVTDVHIYLVGYAGVTPTYVYRDGVLVAGSEWTLYNGTYNNSVAGVGGNLIAYSVIVFTTEQRDFQGRLYDRKEGDRMTADITGPSVERNFIRAIQAIFSHATWGLGESIDATSFDAEAAYLDSLGGLYCDGWLLEQKPAKDYLDELAMVRGIRYGQTSAGAWTVAVDKPATAYAASFGFQDPYGWHNLTARPIKRRTNISEAISTLTLAYRYDPSSRTYQQITSSRTVHPFGQPRQIPMSFIRDHTTADKTACYLAHRFKAEESAVETAFGREGRGILLGERVVLMAPPYGMHGGYEVRAITPGLDSAKVSLVPYESDVYVYTAGTLPSDESPESGADLSRTPPGAPASLVLAASGVEASTQGAYSAWMDLSWSASATAEVTYLVQLKLAGESVWTTWDEPTVSSTRIRGLVSGLSYDVQVKARSRQNLFSTAAQLLAQVAPGDTSAPTAPSAISVIQGTGKSVKITLTASPPADWGDVWLYRKTSNVAPSGGELATPYLRGKKLEFTDLNVAYGTTYYYWGALRDLTGNQSGLSPSSGHSITPVQVPTGDIADSAITAAKIGSLAVETAKINSLAVQNAKIDNLSVTTAKRQLLSNSAQTKTVSAGSYQFYDFTVDANNLFDWKIQNNTNTIKLSAYIDTHTNNVLRIYVWNLDTSDASITVTIEYW